MDLSLAVDWFERVINSLEVTRSNLRGINLDDATFTCIIDDSRIIGEYTNSVIRILV